MKHLGLALPFVLLLGCGSSTPDSAPDDTTPVGGSGGAAGGTGLPDAAAAAGGTVGTGGTATKDGAVDAPPVTCPADAGQNTYEADDPNIQYSGRIDFTDPKKPHFTASGGYVTAKFRGNKLTVMFRDELKYSQKNYYDVIVDDQAPVKITPLSSVTAYDVPVTLTGCEHKVTFIKRTEASIGYCEFLGFKVGELAVPDPKPTRKIEVIGDSITCGSGDEAADGSAQCSEGGWGQAYQSSYMAYGAVLGRMLNAERHTTCVSGIGLVRNYSSLYDARPMPEVYPLLYIDSKTSPPWDTSKFKPDAVVIGLGTNDFSPGDSARASMDETTFANGYIAFIDQLKGYYPGVHVFLVSSPMLGDGWPNPGDTSATSLKNAIGSVVTHYATDTAVHVDKAFITKITGEGCGTHPSAAQQATMAEEIAPVIKTALGW
jgi:lysophospholipase L1-like esterase